MHSLKGAASAAAYPEIERLCHELEARLAPVHRGASASAEDLWGAARGASIAAEALGASAESLAARGEPDAAAIARALAALDAPFPPRPLPGEAALPLPPPPPSSRTGFGSASDAPPEPRGEPGAETVRVSVSRLGELLDASEELLSVAGRHAPARGERGSMEGLLGEMRADAERARRLAARLPEGGLELTRLLDRVLTAAATAQAGLAAREGEREASWRAVASGASDVAGRARALRVLPFGHVARALEQAATGAAEALGRALVFGSEGDEIELDRRVLEGLREPLLHLVRNAVDHGIETPAERERAGKPPIGRVGVSASATGHEARVVVADDGRGLDPEEVLRTARARGLDTRGVRSPEDALALLFEPGFSLREEATAFSGRGVGLDVVRRRIAALHGRIEIESSRGEGTRFGVTVPVDLSVVRGLLVRTRDVRAIFASTTIERLRRVAPEELVSLEGRLYLSDGGRHVPLADLDAALGFGSGKGRTGSAPSPVVVLAVGEVRVALRVDALLDEREFLVRPPGPRLRRAAFVSGTAVLGEGEIALLLDAGDLVRAARPASRAAPEAPLRRSRLLVVDDSVTTRQLERAILQSAGYDVEISHDGQSAWERLAGGEPFDLIVCDVEMPRMDGFQLLARLRSASRPGLERLPVVLVTALARDEDRQRALELGASAYITKGRFDQEELLQVVAELL